MTQLTYNDLQVGDTVLYETDDCTFIEATVMEVLNENEVSIEFSIEGHLTGRKLKSVKAEWCVKKPTL